MTTNESSRQEGTDDELTKSERRAEWEGFEFRVPASGTVRVENASYGDESGEHVYVVSVEGGIPFDCTCPAWKYHNPEGGCKHMVAVENQPAVMHAASSDASAATTDQQVATDGGQSVEDDESLAGDFADYPFSEGDHITVDWSEGQGPKDEITGIVEDIGTSAGETVVGVTDYDDPHFGEAGCTYDCAPEWVTVEKQSPDTEASTDGTDCPECHANGTVTHEPQPGSDTIPTYVCANCGYATFTPQTESNQ